MRRGPFVVLFLVLLTACSQPAEPGTTTPTSSTSTASTGTSPPPPTTSLSPDDGPPATAGPAPTAGPQLPIGDVAEAGTPSWIAEDPMPPSDVSSEYLVEWTGDAGAPEWCPLLVFDGLGDDASDAGIRRATNFGEMLVAWDRPEGPGHDASGEPCDDCGRGAVGLGTFQGPVEMRHPITHMWDDGSIGSLFDGLYGSEMLLRPAGFDCTYWLWSHLGDGHLSGLVSRLRRVEAHP